MGKCISLSYRLFVWSHSANACQDLTTGFSRECQHVLQQRTGSTSPCSQFLLLLPNYGVLQWMALLSVDFPRCQGREVESVCDILNVFYTPPTPDPM